MSTVGEVVGDLSALVGGSIVVKAIGACITQVPPEHIALREHCNRARRTRDTWFGNKKAGELYEICGPGNYVSGGLRSYKIVSLQSRFHELKCFSVVTDRSTKEQMIVNSIAEWGLLTDAVGEPDYEAAYRMSYAPKDDEALVLGVLGLAGSTLRNIMMEIESPQTVKSSDVYPIVRNECQSELDRKFGVELRDLQLIEGIENMVSVLGRRAVEPGAVIDTTEAAVVAKTNGGLHVLANPTS